MVKVGGIILAAGQSQRFGKENKLLADYDGRPLLDYALSCVSALPLSEKVMVSGFDPENTERRAKLFNMDFVYNPEYENGMGQSIATGVAGLSLDLDAYFIFLGDLPRVNAKLCLDVMSAFKRNQGTSLIRPAYNEQAGHPVMIPAKYRNALLKLNQDIGLRDLIEDHDIPVIHTPCLTGACIADIDTPIDPLTRL